MTLDRIDWNTSLRHYVEQSKLTLFHSTQLGYCYRLLGRLICPGFQDILSVISLWYEALFLNTVKTSRLLRHVESLKLSGFRSPSNREVFSTYIILLEGTNAVQRNKCWQRQISTHKTVRNTLQFYFFNRHASIKYLNLFLNHILMLTVNLDHSKFIYRI